MGTLALTFVLAFAVALGLTPLLRAVAPRLGAMDAVQPARKVHDRPTPRLGGVAIVAGFFLALGAALIWGKGVPLEGRRFAALAVGGLVIAALGFVDDLRSLNARAKFAVQFAVAAGLYIAGLRIDAVSHPFGGAVAIGLWGLPLTLLWVVGIINAMNLIDGLDGLAAGVAAVAVGLTLAVSLHRGDAATAVTMAALGGAVVGFLVFNFHPATIFMGDTGSMFLGYVLATSALAAGQKSSPTVAMLVPIVGLGLPIVDTLGSMLRRARRGRPMFSADREHIHHRLLAAGLSHRQTVLLLYASCVASGLAAFALTFAGSRSAAWLLAGWGTLAVGLLHLLSRAAGVPSPAELRAAVEAIREARETEGRWKALVLLARLLGARRVTLRLDVHGEAPSRSTRVWRARIAAGDEEAVSWELVDVAGCRLGTVDLVWSGTAAVPAEVSAALPQALAASIVRADAAAVVVPLRRSRGS